MKGHVSSTFLFQLMVGTLGNILQRVEVPQYAFAGSQANLSCHFDLRSTRLYSLKWYHNHTEFYRYVPTERDQPINIQPSLNFDVHEVYRSDRGVTLCLTGLHVGATGYYRCEVIAEHPTFTTDTAKAYMTVLKEELVAPVLVGAREIYEPSELIKVGCQLSQSFHRLQQHQQPSLQWFLQGSQVGSEWVSPYGNVQNGYGLSLHVPGEQVASSGGSLQAECRLSLGNHNKSVFKTLRVRMRWISYLNKSKSSGFGTVTTFKVILALATIMLI